VLVARFSLTLFRVLCYHAHRISRIFHLAMVGMLHDSTEGVSALKRQDLNLRGLVNPDDYPDAEWPNIRKELGTYSAAMKWSLFQDKKCAFSRRKSTPSQ